MLWIVAYIPTFMSVQFNETSSTVMQFNTAPLLTDLNDKQTKTQHYTFEQLYLLNLTLTVYNSYSLY